MNWGTSRVEPSHETTLLRRAEVLDARKILRGVFDSTGHDETVRCPVNKKTGVGGCYAVLVGLGHRDELNSAGADSLVVLRRISAAGNLVKHPTDVIGNPCVAARIVLPDESERLLKGVEKRISVLSISEVSQAYLVEVLDSAEPQAEEQHPISKRLMDLDRTHTLGRTSDYTGLDIPFWGDIQTRPSADEWALFIKAILTPQTLHRKAPF